MTQTQAFAKLERFRQTIENLSKPLPTEEEFRPAYAERANALSARTERLCARIHPPYGLRREGQLRFAGVIAAWLA